MGAFDLADEGEGEETSLIRGCFGEKRERMTHKFARY